MARDVTACKNTGKWVTSKSGSKELHNVATEITTILRAPPEQRLIENTLLHMWGYISKYSSVSCNKLNSLRSKVLLKKIQQLCLSNDVKYLTGSTSLIELNAWNI